MDKDWLFVGMAWCFVGAYWLAMSTPRDEINSLAAIVEQQEKEIEYLRDLYERCMYEQEWKK